MDIIYKADLLDHDLRVLFFVVWFGTSSSHVRSSTTKRCVQIFLIIHKFWRKAMDIVPWNRRKKLFRTIEDLSQRYVINIDSYIQQNTTPEVSFSSCHSNRRWYWHIMITYDVSCKYVCGFVLCFVWIHDDVVRWKHFPRYWPFVRGIHQWPANSPHKVRWYGALRFLMLFVLFFYLHLNKRLSKLSRRRWLETPSRSLWHHFNKYE